MTIAELESLASYLAHEWELTECEHDDLLAFGAALLIHGWLAETVRTHMEMRAEVLAMVGSEMEEMYQAMKEWRGYWSTT